MTDANSQRKRMEDVLERRLSVAKAEIQQQQLKRVRVEDPKLISGTKSFAKKSFQEKIVLPPKQPSANKFHNKDAEHPDAEYAGFAHAVNDNLLKTNLSERRGGVVDGLMHELLQKGNSAHKYLQGSRSMKIDNWILLDNYVQGRGLSSLIKNNESQNNFKRSKKRMSMKQLKQCGSLDLPKEIRRYKTFLPMHDLWKDYMKQLIKSIGNAMLAPHILDADLHGSIITVANCKMSVLNGVTGIMIRETVETFGIITTDDNFKVVPKRLSVFIFQLECWKVTMLGDKLLNRNANC